MALTSSHGMTVFEHVTALFSFVYALALTHLLARIAELIVARDRVKFSGLLALGMVNAVLVVFANWLSLWDLHVITSWNLASISVQFLFAINVFLICVLVGPKAHDDGPIDLEDFFWRQRPYFLWRSRGLRRFVIVCQPRLSEDSECRALLEGKFDRSTNVHSDSDRTSFS